MQRDGRWGEEMFNFSFLPLLSLTGCYQSVTQTAGSAGTSPKSRKQRLLGLKRK